MKIAILTSSYPRYPGDGTAPFIKSIAESLSFLGHNVHVVAPYDVEIKQSHQDEIPITRFRYIWPRRFHIMGHSKSLKADVKLHPLSYFLLPFFLITGIISLYKVTGDQKSEVIHINWVLPNGPIGMVVALLRRIPYVVSLHGSDGYVANKNFFYRSVAKLVLRKAKAITACSKELQQTALELGANPKHTHLLAWGANPEKFKPKVKVHNEIDDNKIIVSSLGRMVYKKGFDKLIDAWEKISLLERNSNLVLGGDGPLLHDFQMHVTKKNLNGSINFIGRVPWDQVPDFLNVSDIFVLPSVLDKNGNLDGLPTVLLEAMACGNAIVASRIGGVPLVIEDYKNGILVSPGDTDELAKAITYLIRHPEIRERFGKEARLSIERYFNWNNVADYLVRCFRE